MRQKAPRYHCRGRWLLTKPPLDLPLEAGSDSVSNSVELFCGTIHRYARQFCNKQLLQGMWVAMARIITGLLESAYRNPEDLIQKSLPNLWQLLRQKCERMGMLNDPDSLKCYYESETPV